MEFSDPFILLFYEDEQPHVDIFDKTGQPVHRVNMAKLLSEQSLVLKNIQHLLVPKLKWSLRENVDDLISMSFRN